jgi:uncharacterized membrane protein YqjE
MRYEREYEYPGDGGLRERPLGDLLRALAQQGQGLLRDEVLLAKAELRAEAKKASKGGAMMGAGGAVLFAALLLLGVTLVLIGDTFLPAWLSALIVTALYAVAGGVLLTSGKKELRRTEPSRAIQSIKEDGRWAKETMRDIRSSRSANA